ncbi:hypothetical protein L596_023608 [Steinernema carpocapsae]|uniref:Uncharacterized protein n=1 Tax=Steinernema carpocapsae TaxID=34508 RepID=A0A4U5ME58_STECR|nr:hypothetical protein L596_023608 [Steinernema carpocapsae]
MERKLHQRKGQTLSRLFAQVITEAHAHAARAYTIKTQRVHTRSNFKCVRRPEDDSFGCRPRRLEGRRPIGRIRLRSDFAASSVSGSEERVVSAELQSGAVHGYDSHTHYMDELEKSSHCST